ncbi:MAG: helix-turn-helix domain-containing protein [Chloroflexi bacterium]|nr:helix-turn-helix domain-containing protein [Chloroflexota bacterium]
MGTLGVWLRQTREAKGSSLEQVEDATRIRPRFLEALETGDFSAFPGGEVQIRGFLRIYARYLDLASNQVLARYDTEMHGAEAALSDTSVNTGSDSSARLAARPTPQRIAPISASRPGTANLPTLVIVGVAIIVLVAALVAGGYFIIRNIGERVSATATVTPTGPAEPAVWPTATATPPALAVTPVFSVDPEGGVTLSLEATEHVWVRVIADGTMVFSGMLDPGPAASWSGQETISVETGNGAALQVTVNEQLQGAMCGRAEVCTRTWGSTGEIVVP